MTALTRHSTRMHASRIRRWAIAVVVAPWVMVAQAEVAVDPAYADPLAERLRASVFELTTPVLAGRAAGTPEVLAAAARVSAWYEAGAFGPAFAAPGNWFQDFPLSGPGWRQESLDGLQGRNFGARLEGAGLLAGRWIILAAHLDHLGRVDPTASLDSIPAAGAYYAGANDNASGVGIVREVARSLAAADSARSQGQGHPAGAGRRSVMFLNFDAEEVGLQGSAWFVEHSPVPLDSIDAMLNLDTVGRLSDGRLIVSGTGTASPLAAAVEAAAVAAGLAINASRGGWSGSDHMIFNKREIPVLFLFGGPYPEYNRPTDVWASLDYEAMARVARFTEILTGRLRVEPGPFRWINVPSGGLRTDEAGAPNGGSRNENRQTWLGTLPDFSEGVAGYCLAGVFEGSPAATAGLQKGDVLVAFGDFSVEDIASFTTALRAYEPGDLVEVAVHRAGRALRFTVLLGDRSDRR